MGTAKYIGRVGALAVALGVGAAVANTPGIAWADEPDTSSKSTASSEDSTPTTPSTESTDEPAKTAMASGFSGFSTNNCDSATTTTTFDTSTTRSTTTIGGQPVPKVVIRRIPAVPTPPAPMTTSTPTQPSSPPSRWRPTTPQHLCRSQRRSLTRHRRHRPLAKPSPRLQRNAETPTRGTRPTTADDASNRVADNAGPPTEKADTVTVPMGDAAQDSRRTSRQRTMAQNRRRPSGQRSWLRRKHRRAMPKPAKAGARADGAAGDGYRRGDQPRHRWSHTPRGT